MKTDFVEPDRLAARHLGEQLRNQRVVAEFEFGLSLGLGFGVRNVESLVEPERLGLGFGVRNAEPLVEPERLALGFGVLDAEPLVEPERLALAVD
jgi:hypothetical protein